MFINDRNLKVGKDELTSRAISVPEVSAPAVNFLSRTMLRRNVVVAVELDTRFYAQDGLYNCPEAERASEAYDLYGTSTLIQTRPNSILPHFLPR